MNQLENYVQGALTGENNTLRAQNEALLIQLRESNPSEFLVTCSKIMNNQSKSTFMRQSTGAVLGRSAVTKNINGMYYWDYLTPEAKNDIRDNVINTLISIDPLIVNTGASTISQIAAIEISRGSWLDLIDIFAQNVQHDNIAVRKASIISIGYICQQLKSLNAVVNERSCQQLLGSIIIGSRQKSAPQIVECAYKALRNSICFLTPILQAPQVRNETFKIIIENLGNLQYSRMLYESLFQFCKSCYEYLGEYLNQIVYISGTHLALRNQLTILALQLWDAIGEEYNERVRESKIRVQQQNLNYNINIPNYLMAVKDKLMDSIMKCVIIYNKHDLQNTQLRESAVKTLGTFLQSGDRSTIDQVTQFISRIITSQNAGQRQASALIFSALCQSHESQYVKNNLDNGFDFLFSLLSDNQQLVVKNTLVGFKRLLEVFPQVVMTRNNHKQIMEKFLSLIESPDKQICFESLTILCQITDGLSRSKNTQMANDLQYVFKSIVSYYERNLINFHNDFKQGNEKAILIILGLVMATTRRDILLQLIQFSIGKYFSLLQSRIPDCQILLDGMIAIIHTCILALRTSNTDISLMNQICQLINVHIQRFGIEQQSLSLISALAITFNRRFQPKLPQYWVYVMKGLEMASNLRTFKYALSAAGDIARSFESNFYVNGKEVLDLLFDYIHKNIGLQQKIAILTCMGDLILALKEHAEIFAEEALKMSNQCFEAVYEMQKDPNSQQLAEQLKQALIEMYACLLFALNTRDNVNQSLVDHYPKLGYFIVKTCDPSLNPTVSYLKSCLFLMFDCACFYSRKPQNKEMVCQIAQSNQVQRLVNMVKQIKNKSDISELINLIQSATNKFGIKSMNNDHR